MDSTLTLALAQKAGNDILALHLNYRHRTEARELLAFHAVADHYDVQDRLVVDIQFLKDIGGSSLTDRSMPVAAADLQASTVPSSYVPFRNGNFLSIAASWAEVADAESIYIGAVEEDSSGYPDCRKSFFEQFEQTINLGTKPETRIAIETPIITLSKREIVERSVALDVPLHLTWSCYQAERAACGMCDSCALRLRGFARAGVEDPLPYTTRPSYA
jgi:7-cyano-7-deazaguanine synthase